MIRRDLLLIYRRRAQVATPLIFFLLVAAVFPLGLDPRSALLREIAPGIIWVAALLAALLAQHALFGADYEDGSLDQILLSGQPLELLVLGKVFAHWMVTGLPLVILTPLAAFLLFFPTAALPTLLAGLALGTPVLSLLGAVGAALTVSLRGSGMLLPILILPLAAPVLIFGARGAALAAAGESAAAPLYLLASMLAFTVCFAPFAVAAGLRVSSET
jgi:heme exporter protein B